MAESKAKIRPVVPRAVCLNPSCSGRPVVARGVCARCYKICLDLVTEGKTAWDALESAGRARPKGDKTGEARKWILAGILQLR